MSDTLEILVQNDGFLELLADALADKSPRIQGFLYADHHVIRDVYKPWSQQEIWRRQQRGEDDYEACHAAMMRQIEVENLRLAVGRALAMARNPWPGQEKAAESARLALASRPAPRGPDNEGDRSDGRCSSSVRFSYDPRQHLSTSGALNMEH